MLNIYYYVKIKYENMLCHCPKSTDSHRVWIWFDYTLSDPALCTGLQYTVDKDTHVALYITPQPKNSVLAKDQEIRLPVFLLTV
jgi:hypothetical protein